jgi:hypothetical protein
MRSVSPSLRTQCGPRLLTSTASPTGNCVRPRRKRLTTPGLVDERHVDLVRPLRRGIGVDVRVDHPARRHPGQHHAGKHAARIAVVADGRARTGSSSARHCAQAARSCEPRQSRGTVDEAEDDVPCRAQHLEPVRLAGVLGRPDVLQGSPARPSAGRRCRPRRAAHVRGLARIGNGRSAHFIAPRSRSRTAPDPEHSARRRRRSGPDRSTGDSRRACCC